MNEIVLQNRIEDDMISVKDLYQKLGLDMSHYARWCKDNIVNNDMVSENEDWCVRHDGERMDTGFQPNPSQDYYVTPQFAKELCVIARTPAAKELRKKLIARDQVATKVVAEMQKTIIEMNNQINELKEISARDSNRIACLESGTSVSGGKLSKWVQDASADIMELAKYCDCTVKEMYSNVIDRMEQIYGINFQRYFDEYAASHPNEKPIWRIVVIEYYDLKDAFEDAYVKIGRDVGLYHRPDEDEWYDF